MGSKSGGTSMVPSFQSSVTTTAPNAEAGAAYSALLQRAQNVANTPYQAYGGQLVAGFSPDQLAAFNSVNKLQGAQTPYLNSATNMVNQASDATGAGFGSAVSKYLSPYLSSVVDATAAQMKNQFGQQQNDLTSRAIQSGGAYGDRASVANAALANQQGLALGQTLGNLYNQGYGQAVNQVNANAANQLAAAGAMGGLGKEVLSTGLLGANAQLQTGGLQQQLNQQGLSTNYQQWLNQQAFPYNQTQWLAGIEGAIGPNMGGTSSSFGFGEQGQQKPSSMSSLLGAGLSGLGVLGSISTGGLSGMFSPLTSLFRADGGRVAKAPGGGIYSPGEVYSPIEGANWVPDANLPAGRGPVVQQARPFEMKGGNSEPARGLQIPEISDSTKSGLKSGLGALAHALNPSEPIQLPGASFGDVAPMAATAAGPEGLYAHGGLVRRGYDDGGLVDDLHLTPSGLRSYFLSKGANPNEATMLTGAAVNESSLNPSAVHDSGTGYGMFGHRLDRRDALFKSAGSESPTWQQQADFALNELRGRPEAKMVASARSPEDLARAEMFYERPRGFSTVNPAAGDNYSGRLKTLAGLWGDDSRGGVPMAYADAPARPTSDGLAAINAATNDTAPAAAPAESGGFLSPELSRSLIAAGLGMMASRSPYLGNAIGEGGLAGLSQYQNERARQEASALRQAEVKRQADQFAQNLALHKAQIEETRRYHDVAAKQKEAGANDHIGVIGEDQFGQKIYGYTSGPNAGKPINNASAPSVGGDVADKSQSIDFSKTGDEFIQQLPEAERSKVLAIAEGRAKMPSGMGANNPNARRLYSYVTAYDPKFDVGNPEARIQTRKQFASTKPNDAGGQIIAGNTAISHLGELSKWGEKIPQHGWPTWNAAQNKWEEFTGGANEYKRYVTAATLFAKEAEKFYRGVGGTQHEIEALQKLLDPSMSPTQRRAAIQEQAELMRGKVEALRDQWKGVMGDAPMPEIVRGKAEKSLEMIDNLAGMGGGSEPKSGLKPLPADELDSARRALARGVSRELIEKKAREGGYSLEGL